MPKTKYSHATLSGLIDSDDDDDLQFNVLPSPDSAAENKAPAKQRRAKATMPATKVTKRKTPARRSSGRITAKVAKPEPTSKATKKAPVARGKRKALADRTNQQNGSDTEEVEDFEQDQDTVMVEELESTVVSVEAAKPTVTKKKTVAGVGKETKLAKKMTQAQESKPDAATKQTTAGRRGRPAKRPVAADPSPEKFIPETQIPDDMEVDQGNDDEEDEIMEETVVRVASNVRRARPEPIIHRRAGSGSDTERSDPALRRKLGDITKKFDNLNIKYQDLREVGLKEAEKNFDRLKKQSEDRAAVSDKLIASLKAEVAAQTAATKEARSLKKKVESQATEIGSLKAQISQLTATLSETRVEAQNEKTSAQEKLKDVQNEVKKANAENKTLLNKLAINRTAAASVEVAGSKVPGSAVKASGGIRMVGSVEAAQIAQLAQLKEDLYVDLTELVVRNVKREPEDDVFDCLQTGRNGTLHFKLAVANNKSSEGYNDAQCQYIPQLDPSRDEALIELLPDFLVEEITFPRAQAAKFYARVWSAINGRVD